MLNIDLNCDMGEGIGNEKAIMPYISSANIACGYHAGDESSMRSMVELAIQCRVAIGAHPAYPDREHFGRMDMLDGAGIGLADLPKIISDQLALLQKICIEHGAGLHHVKLHGALYNRAANDPSVSAIVCGTIRQFDPALLLYGLSGSAMQAEAERCGLRFVQEAFADRSYREDGNLTPRTEADALIEDPVLAVTQVLNIVREGKIMTTRGTAIFVDAGTICIHGDGPNAVGHVRAIREELDGEGVAVQAPF
jgi:UPF0271 protein